MFKPSYIKPSHIIHNQVIMSQQTDQAMLSMGSDEYLQEMFTEFTCIQATNTTSKSKSKHTANPEIFSGNGRNTKVMHEKLESFITSLSLKMTLNADWYLTEISQIAYIFSHMTGIAQSYISAKITAGQYLD